MLAGAVQTPACRVKKNETSASGHRPWPARARLAVASAMAFTLGAAATCPALAAPASAPTGDTRENLLWVVVHSPPTAILHGPSQGQGFVDKTLGLFMAGLPAYRHQLLDANYARAVVELRSKPNVCVAAFLRLPEREAFVHFSEPYLTALPYQLFVAPARERGDRPRLALDAQGRVDLAQLLQERGAADTQPWRVGVVGARSLGPRYDQMLKALPPGARLTVRHGNPSVSGLLRMLADDKVDAIIAFPTELSYAARELGLATAELRQLPLRGADTATTLHVGCSRTAQGARAIAEINGLIRKQAGRIEGFYRDWLPAVARGQLSGLRP